MKQFNLEEYLKNPSKKIVTRDGRKVKRILCTDARGNYPIVALVESYDGTADKSLQYTKDGRYSVEYRMSVSDLFFAPEKHEGWINIYAGINDNSYPGNHIFKSKEEAIEAADNYNYVSTIKIEWED